MRYVLLAVMCFIAGFVVSRSMWPKSPYPPSWANGVMIRTSMSCGDIKTGEQTHWLNPGEGFSWTEPEGRFGMSVLREYPDPDTEWRAQTPETLYDDQGTN